MKPVLSRRAFVCAAPLVLAAGRLRAQSSPVLRLALDGRLNYSHAALALADADGLFMAAGLDVRFEPTPSAAEAMGKVVDNKADLAMGDLPILMRFIDENRQAALRATLCLVDRSPHAIVTRLSRDASPNLQSLNCKKLGGNTLDTAMGLWPLLARVNRLDPQGVQIETLGPNVREPALIAGEIDGIFGASAAMPVNLAARGLPVADLLVLDYADYGLDLYSSVLVAAPVLLAESSPLARFQTALIEGYRRTIARPDAAVTALMKRDELGDAATLSLQLDRLIKRHILTGAVRANGFGGFDAGRMVAMTSVLGSIKPYKAPLEPTDFLSLTHLPPASARQVLDTP